MCAKSVESIYGDMSNIYPDDLYQYDNAYRLTRETRVNKESATTFDQTFEYDAVGNRTRSMKNGTEITYTYNSANQLIQEIVGNVTKTYSFDKNGNMIRIVAQGDPTAIAPTAFTYDAQNRLIQWSDATTTESTEYRGAGYQRHRQPPQRH